MRYAGRKARYGCSSAWGSEWSRDSAACLSASTLHHYILYSATCCHVHLPYDCIVNTAAMQAISQACGIAEHWGGMGASVPYSIVLHHQA